MSNSKDDIQVGDLWEFCGNSFFKPYVIIIAEVLISKTKTVPSSVYYVKPDNDLKHNITISYLLKEYRKIS
jgi:hypothetical protein